MVSQVGSQVDWTVGRCNRLMRPLVTRIQKLRVLKEEREASKRPTVPAASASKAKGLESSDESSEDTCTKSGRNNDPDWMSVPKKKKKTAKGYSARNTSARDPATEIGVRTPARGKMQGSLLPGELSIPTPYLARLSSDPPSDAFLPGANRTFYPSQPGMTSKTAKDNKCESSTSGLFEFRKKAYFAEGEDEEAVASNAMRNFVEILHATNTSPDPEEQKRSSPSHGTRSLWATCCAKFGATIGEVEADPEPEEDGLLDAGADYYAMAENLELPERNPGGRLQLRLIVRAHATYVIVSAVEEGLVTARVLKQYLPHLFRPSEGTAQPASMIEGELLLSKSHVLVTSALGRSCPTKHRNHFYTHILNSAMPGVGGEQRLGLDYRQLALVLRHPEFPVEWMASKSIMPVWKHVFRTLLDSKSSRDIQDAYQLLRETVDLAVGLKPSSSAAERVLSEIPAAFVQRSANCPKCPRAPYDALLVDTSPAAEGPTSDLTLSKAQLIEALTNTLNSMSTLFASFSIAHNIKSVELPNVNIQVILSALNLLSDNIAQYHANSRFTAMAGAKDSKAIARRAISILAATMLAKIAGCKLAHGMSSLSIDSLVHLMKRLDSEACKNSANSVTILDFLPKLVCSIARRTSQVLRADNFETLRDLVRALAKPEAASQEISSSTTLFLKQLAFSSAHHYAEISKDVTHYSLIDEIEKEIGAAQHLDFSKTPFRPSTKVQTDSRGLKWEEGICEWVLSTPPKPSKSDTIGPKKKKKKTVQYLFGQAVDSPWREGDYSSEDDLPVPKEGMWETEIDNANVNRLCELINSSSPISIRLPAKYGGKNIRGLPEMRIESDRVKNIKVASPRLPVLKRRSTVDSDDSDDELSFHGPKSRKRPSSSNLRSSFSGPSKLQGRSKLARDPRRDDSEDELGF